MGTVAGELVELDERALVEQVVDALAGGQLAALVLALDGPLGPGVKGLFLALGQLLEPLVHGVRVLTHELEATGRPRLQRGPRSSAR